MAISSRFPIGKNFQLSAITDELHYFKYGHKFVNWKLNDTTYYNDKATVLFNDSPINLSAQWSPIQYTISFYKNNDSATGTMTDQSFSYNESKALTLNSYALQDYSFLGWAIDSSSKVVSYTNGQTVLNLAAEDGSNIKLYAVWQSLYGEITYDECFGNDGYVTITKTDNSQVRIPDTKIPNRILTKAILTSYGITDVDTVKAINDENNYLSALQGATSETTKDNATLYNAMQLQSVTIQNVLSIGSYALGYNNNYAAKQQVHEWHFENRSVNTIPDLGGLVCRNMSDANHFKCYVPSRLYDAWIAADIWKDIIAINGVQIIAV